MKATGIIRRVDDLGRVVIPREIRQTLHLTENAPLEIYTDKDSIIFKKYIPMDVNCIMHEALDTIEDFEGIYLGNFKNEIINKVYETVQKKIKEGK